MLPDLHSMNLEFLKISERLVCYTTHLVLICSDMNSEMICAIFHDFIYTKHFRLGNAANKTIKYLF